MELSPEERKKIYEEEKARIEARERIEREKQKPPSDSTVNLQPNVAGLLCYLGAWITGIIFFVIERKNRWIRFHAAQSLVVFGSFFVIGILIGWIPVFGRIVTSVLGVVGFILWIVLMVKAYNGERYKVFIAGDIAESMVASSGQVEDYRTAPRPEKSEETPTLSAAPAVKPESAYAGERDDGQIDDFFDKKRAVRISGSAFAIAWSIVLLVFFNFFNEYVAYYNADTVNGEVVWTRTPFFTDDISLWLPVLNAALAVSILGHIIMIIFDRNLLRQILQFVIDALGLVAVFSLLSIFPFDFTMIPGSGVAAGVEAGVTALLALIALGFGIGLIVRLVKILVSVGHRARVY
jgi:uncharacterized membrane protein